MKYVSMHLRQMLFTIPLLGFVSVPGFAKTKHEVPNIEDADLQQCPAADKTPNSVSIKNDPDEPLVDLSRELKDLGTEFVVKEFFTSQTTLFNFMKLVYGTVNKGLDNYKAKNNLDDRAAFFLFKGGNVMRLLANGIFAMLPPEALKLLKDNYGDYFKRSDADFSVFINEDMLNGLDYETVLEEITAQVYRSLNMIRRELTANPEKYFNLSQLKTKVANGIFQKYFARLNDLESVKDETNRVWHGATFDQFQLGDEAANPNLRCNYEGQRDVSFEYGESTGIIIGASITDRGNWIQNSVNKTLSWAAQRNEDWKVAFHLVRAKVAFEYSFHKNGRFKRRAVGGELIDVSIPTREDFRLKTFHANYDKWVAEYTLRLEETDEVFSFKAESIEGIVADIAEILFEQHDRPWNAPKYGKRVDRLFFFGIAELMKTLGLGSDRIGPYINDARAVIAQLEALPLSADSESEANNIVTRAQGLAAAYPELSIINEVIVSSAKLVLEEMLKKPQEGDAENLKEFLNTINKNFDIILQLAPMQPRKINPVDAYNATMDKLL